MAAAAAKHAAWVHVDAAYAGAAAVLPDMRERYFQGVEVGVGRALLGQAISFCVMCSCAAACWVEMCVEGLDSERKAGECCLCVLRLYVREQETGRQAVRVLAAYVLLADVSTVVGGCVFRQMHDLHAIVHCGYSPRCRQWTPFPSTHTSGSSQALTAARCGCVSLQ